jgi:hypothetical protein
MSTDEIAQDMGVDPAWVESLVSMTEEFRVFIERPQLSGSRLVRFAGCRPLMAD